MQQQNYQNLTRQNLEETPIGELRKYWSSAWNLKPHKYISREMLITSLLHKIREAKGKGLSCEQKAKLDHLVNAYRRSRSSGSVRQLRIKSGTQLVKQWKGRRHIVMVKNGCFEYEGKNTQAFPPSHPTSPERDGMAGHFLVSRIRA